MYGYLLVNTIQTLVGRWWIHLAHEIFKCKDCNILTLTCKIQTEYLVTIVEIGKMLQLTLKHTHRPDDSDAEVWHKFIINFIKFINKYYIHKMHFAVHDIVGGVSFKIKEFQWRGGSNRRIPYSSMDGHSNCWE